MQFPLNNQNLTLAIQLPSQVLVDDVPYGKIIEIQFLMQPLETVLEFPVPIPRIVILIAGPIFPSALDSYSLKIVHEYLTVMTHEGFHRAGFSEIRVCPVCCPVFGRW